MGKPVPVRVRPSAPFLNKLFGERGLLGEREAMNNEIRWKQRFQNFEKASDVFQRRVGAYRLDSMDEGYQMALVQAFEIVIELSWKVLKDYLEEAGVQTLSTPKTVIRQAFQARLFHDAEIWMEALKMRNETSHTYNLGVMGKVLDFIAGPFDLQLKELHHTLKQFL